ncbi:Hypothetical_protein [Hexamita inflata]|uniref:Hypothetical_protein n=1 Tax=Hexamita inflata TaxID=28002 RepID=A0AA86US77_9EUKA|nr:Hypothetical protein HINF_LOCUS50296 [Hexamita inflata]
MDQIQSDSNLTTQDAKYAILNHDLTVIQQQITHSQLFFDGTFDGPSVSLDSFNDNQANTHFDSGFDICRVDPHESHDICQTLLQYRENKIENLQLNTQEEDFRIEIKVFTLLSEEFECCELYDNFQATTAETQSCTDDYNDSCKQQALLKQHNCSAESQQNPKIIHKEGNIYKNPKVLTFEKVFFNKMCQEYKACFSNVKEALIHHKKYSQKTKLKLNFKDIGETSGMTESEARNALETIKQKHLDPLDPKVKQQLKERIEQLWKITKDEGEIKAEIEKQFKFSTQFNLNLKSIENVINAQLRKMRGNK